MTSSQVERLIMVATSSWRWDPGHHTCRQHEDMLGELLDPQRPGRSWFCVAPPAERRTWRRTPDLPRAERRTDIDPSDWYAGGPDATEPVRNLMDDLRQLCFEYLRAPAQLSGIGLLSFRHRVYLDRDRALALLDPARRTDVRSPFVVVLDFRFRLVQQRLTCRLNVSVWSHTPRSPNHCPGTAERIGTGNLVAPRFRASAITVCGGITGWLRAERHYVPETLRVFDRPYRAPVFWVANCRQAPSTPAAAFLTEPGSAAGADLTELTRQLLLGEPDERGTAVSVLDGELLTLRRFVTDGRDDVPHYLMLPGRTVPRPARRPDQENWIREVIRFLTDVETDAATELFDAQSELEIWDNHLQVYQRVVDRGTSLWDGLAGHLVQHRAQALARVHRSVELIHQTLLQGVADVDNVSTAVAASESRIPRALRTLQEVYDRELTEFTPRGHTGLLQAVVHEGHFADVRSRATEIQRFSTRVSRNYRDLVQAISDAFDERRVRETDALQRTTFALGLFVGLVGLVTVLDTTFALQLPAGENLALLRGTAWGLGGLLTLGLLLGLGTWLRSGRLGTRGYRRSYRLVWDLLRLCSTDHLSTVARRLDPAQRPLQIDDLVGLERLTERARAQQAEQAAAWAEIDARLARRYAALWDRVSGHDGDVRVPPDRRGRWVDGPDADPADPPTVWRARRQARRDLRQLTLMIEKWSLRTFLIAERPLLMCRANLPRLTVLYRCAFQLLADQAIRVVSNMDFFFVFEDPAQGLDWERVQQLNAWLDRTVRRLRHGAPDGGVSARDLLGELETLGIAAGMAYRSGSTGSSSVRDDVVRRLGRAADEDAFDPFGPSYRADPYRTRPASPVAYCPSVDRWVVSGHRQVREVLRDTDRFSPVEARRPLAPMVDDATATLERGAGWALSGREVVQQALSTAHVRRAERSFAADVERRIGEITTSGGPVDLVSVLLRPACLRAVLVLIGQSAPGDEEVARLVRLTSSARRSQGLLLAPDEQRAAAEAGQELRAYCDEVVGGQPADGVAGLPPAARSELVMDLIRTGPEATAALLGNALWLLLRAGRWPEAVLADRGGAVVEECLRFATPIVQWRREAAVATTIGGYDHDGGDHDGPALVVPAGARILVHIGAANRDPGVFDDPDEFRPDRSHGEHLAFGHGVHACPAAALVRGQVTTTLAVLARRWPGLRLAEPDVEPPFSADISMRGPERLVVQYESVRGESVQGDSG